MACTHDTPSRSTTRAPGRFLRALSLAVLPTLLGALLGCGDDDAEPPMWFGAGVGVGERLLLIDEAHDEAVLIDAADPDLGVQARTTLSPGTVWLGKREDHPDHALVLSSGRRGVEATTELTLVRENGSTNVYSIDVPYNRVVQPPDGRFAVLFFERGARSLAFAPNGVAVVDLDTDPDDGAVTHTSFRTPLGPLATVAVSPALQVAGEPTWLAVASSAGYLGLLDLEHADRPDVLVELGDRDALPEQVLFSPERGEIYLRARGSDDAFVLALDEPDDDDERENAFWPGVQQLAVAEGFADLAIAGAQDSGMLLALTPDSRQLHLIDVQRADTTRVDLEDDTGRLVRLSDDEEVERDEDHQPVLGFNPGSRDLTLIEAESLTDDPIVALRRIETDAPIESVEVLPAQRKTLLFQATATLGVLDHDSGALQPVSVNAGLSDVVFDEAFGQLLVAPESDYLLAVVDLESGQTREILLDEPIAFTVPIVGAGRIAVVHPDATLTLVDPTEPGRDTLERILEFR